MQGVGSIKDDVLGVECFSHYDADETSNHYHQNLNNDPSTDLVPRHSLELFKGSPKVFPDQGSKRGALWNGLPAGGYPSSEVRPHSMIDRETNVTTTALREIS